MNTTGPKIIGVTGWKNSGKTTMVASLVSEFKNRGIKVSTIKHAHHSFDIDHEGTDSWKHRQAGAGEVALVSKNRWALMHELTDEDEPPLGDIISKLAPCDLIIIEGFKREGHSKIELIRNTSTSDKPLWVDDPAIIAIVSDDPVPNCTLPVFPADAIGEIADFINAQICRI